jgi:RHS repeat-associated protein
MVNESGTVTLTQSYDPYGTVIPSSLSGAGVTSYGFTGEYQGNDLVYLRSRMYAPGMGRFMSRDTWGGDESQPMSYNAWLYVYANPVVYTDATGYIPIMIIACGKLTGGACEHGTPLADYNNMVPLSPFFDWAHANGYAVMPYDYDLYGGTGGGKARYAEGLKYFMMQRQSDEFILVGHSAGADAVIWAAYLYLSEGGDPGKILGVMALDMDFPTEKDQFYTQGEIDSITEKEVNVAFFHSRDYQDISHPLDSIYVDPDCRTGRWINSNEKFFNHTPFGSGITFHKYLAVDQAGFDKYMKPVLDEWSK